MLCTCKTAPREFENHQIVCRLEINCPTLNMIEFPDLRLGEGSLDPIEHINEPASERPKRDSIGTFEDRDPLPPILSI